MHEDVNVRGAGRAAIGKDSAKGFEIAGAPLNHRVSQTICPALFHCRQKGAPHKVVNATKWRCAPGLLPGFVSFEGEKAQVQASLVYPEFRSRRTLSVIRRRTRHNRGSTPRAVRHRRA